MWKYHSPKISSGTEWDQKTYETKPIYLLTKSYNKTKNTLTSNTAEYPQLNHTCKSYYIWVANDFYLAKKQKNRPKSKVWFWRNWDMPNHCGEGSFSFFSSKLAARYMFCLDGFWICLEGARMVLFNEFVFQEMQNIWLGQNDKTIFLVDKENCG